MLDSIRWLAGPLFDLLGATLTTFHGWGAPWWLAIVMLTVVVRILLFPLTVSQVKNARKMQEIAPEMRRIREEHKDDIRRQHEEITKLHAERRANPMGGCLPLLVQLPVFVVLYYTIKGFESLESFRTGGLLWFADLTVHDPLYALPVLYSLTMMASQEFALRNTAPEQRRLMRLLPVVSGVFLAHFPAGLLVYSVTSNVVGFFQNLLIYGRRSDQPKRRGGQTLPPGSVPERRTEERPGTHGREHKRPGQT